MTGEEFYYLFQSHRILRKELCGLVWQYSDKTAIRIELLQSVWMAIGEALAGENDLFYYGLACHVCERIYRLKYRYTPKTVDSTERQRLCRRRRFYIKKKIYMDTVTKYPAL